MLFVYAEDILHQTNFLRKVLSDKVFRNEEDQIILKISEMLRKGISEEKIKHLLGVEIQAKSYLIEFAKARIAIKNKFSRSEQLWMDKYSASYSTPEISGLFRSRRLSGKSILDVGSGAGMQSIFFSRHSKVSAIEKDVDRFLMSRINAEVYDSQARFILSDYRDFNFRDITFDTVFSDPLRASSSRERTLEKLEPNPISIMEAFKDYNPLFVFDLPPMIGKEKLSRLPGELEYMSLNGSIHRLTSYGNSERTYSAVMLPQERKYSSKTLDSYVKEGSWSDTIFVPDPSLFYSGIENQYCKEHGMQLVRREKRKSIYAANDIFNEPMGEFYMVIKVTNYDNIISTLRETNCKRVFLRYDSAEYYRVKMEMEKHLSGTGDCYIFKIGEEYALCRKVKL